MKNYDVHLSLLAELKLNLILEYLETEWGNKAKKTFLNKLTDVKEQLSAHPKSFPESDIYPGIYKGVVTSHVSIYYRIQDETVEVITVIDNRQDSKQIINQIKNYFSRL